MILPKKTIAVITAGSLALSAAPALASTGHGSSPDRHTQKAGQSSVDRNSRDRNSRDRNSSRDRKGSKDPKGSRDRQSRDRNSRDRSGRS